MRVRVKFLTHRIPWPGKIYRTTGPAVSQGETTEWSTDFWGLSECLKYYLFSITFISTLLTQNWNHPLTANIEISNLPGLDHQELWLEGTQKWYGASLVAQWLRVCLPMQGARVRALVWEDPACRGAAGPVRHSCWACASGACAPQQERPRQWGARAPRWGVAPARRNWRGPLHRGEDPTQPGINK